MVFYPFHHFKWNCMRKREKLWNSLFGVNVKINGRLICRTYTCNEFTGKNRCLIRKKVYEHRPSLCQLTQQQIVLMNEWKKKPPSSEASNVCVYVDVSSIKIDTQFHLIHRNVFDCDSPKFVKAILVFAKYGVSKKHFQRYKVILIQKKTPNS